ncbi:NapC/NirT family cytochrome c [Myxococcota bacterium]|nr:NapC/NirT family cytochrome c [Myxococcota bacterium]
MKRPSKYVLTGIALGLLVVVGTPSAYLYNYVNHDPRFCISCHVMNDAYDRWQTSEHSRIDCHSCHPSEMKTNLRHLYFTVVDPHAEPSQYAEVDRNTCMRCHQQGGDRWQQVLTTAGHDVHVTQRGLQCMDCHSESVHRFAAPAQICAKCHEKIEMHERTMEHLQCLQCHDFLADAPGAELKPGKATCWTCHGDESAQQALAMGSAEAVRAELEAAARSGGFANVRYPDTATTTAAKAEPATVDDSKGPKTAGELARKIALGEGLALAAVSNVGAKIIPRAGVHGDLDCKLCHNPHKPDFDGMRSGILCQNCHEGEPFEALKSGPKEHECRGCHKPHDAHGAAKEICSTCHSAFVTTLTKKHADQCDTCHRPHSMKAFGDDCKSCHANEAADLFTHAPPQHDKCETCHEPHAPAPKEQACTPCHATQAVLVNTAIKVEHQQCTTCHEPHGAKPTAQSACRSCHLEHAAKIRNAGVPEHENCRSCHMTSHGQPQTDRSACVNCHVEQAKLTAVAKTPKEHTQCDSCHLPHEPKAKAELTACMTCHVKQVAPEGHRSHEGKCTTCHQQHGPAAATTATCQSCHKDVKVHAKGVEKHQQCISCHAPHEGGTKEEAKGLASASCSNCHTKQMVSVMIWPKLEHQTCSNCHVGHDAGTPKPCASCHEQMGKQMQGTKHTACTQCHAPHEAKAVGEKAWWSNCATCHAKNVEAVAQRTTPTHSSCENCHKSHAFERPTCQSCHQDITKQLMHQVKEHGDCRSCHDTHGKDPPLRESCVSCHKQQAKDHFPESPRCDSCHPFGIGEVPPPPPPKK